MSAERNTNIADVLFPVEQQPIFATCHTAEPALFDDLSPSKTGHVVIPNFSAIVDVERHHVFSVVSNNYRLITNEVAICLGEQCFCNVFSQTTASGMEVFNITLPKTRSFCHIDYFHAQSNFEPWQDDTWVPFMRVTNSYNRTKLLSFDLGFCRSICTNGVIFGKRSITFRYQHTVGNIPRTATFNMNFGELKNFETQFIEKLHNLKRYYVPNELMLPIACRAFSIQATNETLAKPNRRDSLLGFRNHVTQLTDKYFQKLGPNGYAALNVITDIASHPVHAISPAVMVDQLQKRCGDWTDEFISQIKDDQFKFERYLGDYITTDARCSTP